MEQSRASTITQLPEDMDSSDMEYEPAVKKPDRRQRGSASIAKIIEASNEDRLKSKQTVKELEFGHGAPGTRYQQELWTDRFNAFRTHTLKKSIENPFNGDDIIRFFDSVIEKLQPGYKDKPAVGQEHLYNAFRTISEYGTFTYASGYELTKRDVSRVKTFIDKATREGRLTKGLWNERVRLNFMTVSRMARAWLEHHHKNGTLSWDITLARLMSVVLVTSLGCRAGEAAQPRLYCGKEYLQYKHVKLLLEGEPRFENLRAHFKLEFTKGGKDVRNKTLDLYLSPLDDPRYRHMCVPSLLLIHALRHGLVRGSSIQEVLEDTAETDDGIVVWKFPNRPVLCAFTASGIKRCDLDKPAGIDQLLQSVKQMGVVSNILTRVYVHALRYGAAQDIAHLPQAQGSGFTTNSVRQALGHTNAAYHHGTTEDYVGDPTQEFYNDRAAREFVHPFGVQFSEQSADDFINKPITEDEIRAWQDRNEVLNEDRTSRTARRRAQNNIRRERHEEFLKTAKSDRRKRGSASTAEAATPDVISSFVASHQEREETIRPGSNTSLDCDGQSGSNLTQIDPRLLNGDALDQVEVDSDQFDTLRSHLFLNATPHGSDEEQRTDFDDMAVLEEQRMESTSADNVQITASAFVSAYSTINIVNNNNFAKAWPDYETGKTPFAEGIGRHSVRGNTRNDPTPFEFRCKKNQGCRYRHIREDVMAEHERICNQALVARAIAKEAAGTNFSCDEDGCSKAFGTQRELVAHIRTDHKFEPKACPEGCDPDKIYTTLTSYNMHMDRVHSGRWPTQCRYPNCSDTKQYNDASAYSKHLQLAHELKTKAQRAPYLPDQSETKLKKVWEPASCPIEGCPTKTRYKDKYDLKLHIVKKHGLSKDEANALAACGYVMKPAVTAMAGKKRKTQAALQISESDEGDYEAEKRPVRKPVAAATAGKKRRTQAALQIVESDEERRRSRSPEALMSPIARRRRCGLSCWNVTGGCSCRWPIRQ